VDADTNLRCGREDWRKASTRGLRHVDDSQPPIFLHQTQSSILPQILAHSVWLIRALAEVECKFRELGVKGLDKGYRVGVTRPDKELRPKHEIVTLYLKRPVYATVALWEKDYTSPMTRLSQEVES